MRARENPFATDRVLQVRYRRAGFNRERLLDRLAQLGQRGAIVGPHGSGKTTLLEELAPGLRARGFRPHLARVDRLAARLPEGAEDFLLLDGAERLGAFAWWRVQRAAGRLGGLVITAHRPGRLPTLWECSTDPALLGEILSELAAQLPPSFPPPAELWRRHRGNLREALRELYDRSALSASPRPGR